MAPLCSRRSGAGRLSTTSKSGRRCPWEVAPWVNTTSMRISQTGQARLLFQPALLQRSMPLGLGSLYAETPRLGRQLPQILAALCIIFTQIPYTNSVHKNPYTKSVHKKVHIRTQIRTQNRTQIVTQKRYTNPYTKTVHKIF